MGKLKDDAGRFAKEMQAERNERKQLVNDLRAGKNERTQNVSHWLQEQEQERLENTSELMAEIQDFRKGLGTVNNRIKKETAQLLSTAREKLEEESQRDRQARYHFISDIQQSNAIMLKDSNASRRQTEMQRKDEAKAFVSSLGTGRKDRLKEIANRKREVQEFANGVHQKQHQYRQELTETSQIEARKRQEFVGNISQSLVGIREESREIRREINRDLQVFRMAFQGKLTMEEPPPQKQSRTIKAKTPAGTTPPQKATNSSTRATSHKKEALSSQLKKAASKKVSGAKNTRAGN